MTGTVLLFTRCKPRDVAGVLAAERRLKAVRCEGECGGAEHFPATDCHALRGRGDSGAAAACAREPGCRMSGLCGRSWCIFWRSARATSLIEVALIQVFVLFLGHPDLWALTVVIFSDDAGFRAASGAFSAGKLVKDRNGQAGGGARRSQRRWWRFWPRSYQPVLTAGVGLPLIVKMMATVILIAPVGFVMGIPFPTGLADCLRSGTNHPCDGRRSLNAAASVIWDR